MRAGLVTNHGMKRLGSALLPCSKRLQGAAGCGKRAGDAYFLVREPDRSPQDVVPCDRLPGLFYRSPMLSVLTLFASSPALGSA
jgi:hypothetical protein